MGSLQRMSKDTLGIVVYYLDPISIAALNCCCSASCWNLTDILGENGGVFLQLLKRDMPRLFWKVNYHWYSFLNIGTWCDFNWHVQCIISVRLCT